MFQQTVVAMIQAERKEESALVSLVAQYCRQHLCQKL